MKNIKQMFARILGLFLRRIFVVGPSVGASGHERREPRLGFEADGCFGDRRDFDLLARFGIGRCSGRHRVPHVDGNRCCVQGCDWHNLATRHEILFLTGGWKNAQWVQANDGRSYPRGRHFLSDFCERVVVCAVFDCAGWLLD